jgi:UDP:flavonoid glycosyltransferase YjiC (YdhE family)
MKILLAATPLSGHLNPIMSIARILISHGHEVLVNTATAVRGRVEQVGARFVPFPSAADLDLHDMEVAFPERRQLAGLNSTKLAH